MSFEDFYEKHKGMTLEEADALRAKGLNPSSYYQLWLEENDDYGRASIITENDAQNLVDRGYTVIYRGMPDSFRSTGESKLKDIQDDGGYFTGTGIYGDGLYFSNSRETAHLYATGFDYDRGHGAMIAALIKPTAKVAVHGDMLRELGKNHDEAFSDGRVGLDGLVSVYARSKGYDIIQRKITEGESFYVVLNREAVYMVDKLGEAQGPYDARKRQWGWS